ncbi:conserved oligomeric Golgi complex subunit 3, putative [Plasmodium vivax]|uniref:Uncharacterized protein n=1 Tax=Plasmodium vivax (strain Brazil I) TaxID=1033975 RepID=A0A0J9STU2_PLAV1|nr:hypothetical protein PVBG_02133 [Plasmodium vivax Brazil I]CAI7721995.1 conserved oligomeric Golgi complex subunit 3, putative [Plasmodium vivax]
MEGGTSNKDKLFFKLYEYINKLDNSAGDDVSLEKEGRKNVLYVSKKAKGKKRSGGGEVTQAEVKGEGRGAHSLQAAGRAKRRESKIKARSCVAAGAEGSGPLGGESGEDSGEDGGSYTISCSSSCSSYSSRGDETAAPTAPRDCPLKAEKDDRGGGVNGPSYEHIHPKKKVDEKTKKKGRTRESITNPRSDPLSEVQNYYVISKMNRKMEEHKSVGEVKMICSQGSSNLLAMIQKIDHIISAYEKIRDELDKLEKKKQFIYDTFYSIFLNYYSRYEEVKVIKGNKRRVERHLKFYTNVERFEKVLSHMEKNEYAYFIDMYNNSLQKSGGKESSAVVLEGDEQSDYGESETDSGDEDGEVPMDNWVAEDTQNGVASYGTEGGDTHSEENNAEDEGSHEIDNYLLSDWEKEEEVSFPVGGYAAQRGQHHDEGALQRGALNGEGEAERAALYEQEEVEATAEVATKRVSCQSGRSNKLGVQQPSGGLGPMGGNPVEGQLRGRIWWAKRKQRRSSAGRISNGVATGGGHNGGPRRGRANRGSEKNEIYHMLQFSEEAIKFFKKNGTYLHAKAKLAKYQAIIRRILKYIINLFRDVLNNAELNMPGGRGGESLPLYGKDSNVPRELSCKGKWWEGSTLGGDNPIWGKHPPTDPSSNSVCEKRLPGEDSHVDSVKFDQMKDPPEGITDETGEQKDKPPHEEANSTEMPNLLSAEEQMEESQMYRNINMIYFSKYINEVEYYRKFKIKCSCMRDVIHFIYEKSVEDENDLYTEEYNQLENFYVSTRVKILNSNVLSSNVLSNFEYLLKKDICKYIKNVCLLAMYVSKLEVDLYKHIFNNKVTNSVSIILNSIGVCIFDCLHDCILQLNNIQLIRKIIRIIYVDVIDTYSDNSYRIICDYLKNICKILKEKLLYVIEMYISYYTKNTTAHLPYVCFYPLRKKFINMVNNFLYDEYLLTCDAQVGECPVGTAHVASAEGGPNAQASGQANGQANMLHSSAGSNPPMGKDPPGGGKRELMRSCDNSEEGNPWGGAAQKVDDPSMESTSSQESRASRDSLTSRGHSHPSECNRKVLSEKNVYKPFSFHRWEFNKDTKLGLRGIDLNIIGTILILKTILFIIDEETLLELFRECLENSFNSISSIYKDHLKSHPQDMFNGSLYLIKNLSLLLYLFYKVTKDREFARFYLHSGLTEQLLFGASPKEWTMESQTGGGKRESDKGGAENENSILCFFKRVYNMSSQNGVQNRILAAFNEAVYNFTVATVSRVCSPLIKILSMEYKEGALEKEEEIKKMTHDFLNAKRSRQPDLELAGDKMDFSFLREINFHLLKEFAEKVTNERGEEAPKCSNLDDLKKSLQSFKQNVCNLFPRIYFYVKLFICSNTDKPDENDFFPGLFSHIVGLLTYRIMGLLSEVYLVLRLKYAHQVEAIFEENYVNDILLFLNSSERYACSFADVHQYLDANKNYNIWGE